jgi:arsenate reductase
MAEAIVNTWLGDEWEAVSAGTRPAKTVHPNAVETLAEIGIEWQGHSAKHADNFRANSFDLVVTLCDNARRTRPAWLGQSVHLGFPDPAKVTGNEEEVRAVFRAVRDAMVAQVPVLLREQAG